MKINLRKDIARLVFTFEGVEYNLTNGVGRIIENPSEAFIAFVDSTPELEVEYDESEESPKKKKSKKTEE